MLTGYIHPQQEHLNIFKKNVIQAKSASEKCCFEIVKVKNHSLNCSKNFDFSKILNFKKKTQLIYRFTQDIEDMTGYRPGWYWQLTWRFLAPFIMTGILISSVVYMILKTPTYAAWDPVQVCTLYSP